MEYPWFFFHEAQDFPQALPTLVVTHFLMTVFRARSAPGGGYCLLISWRHLTDLTLICKR